MHRIAVKVDVKHVKTQTTVSVHCRKTTARSTNQQPKGEKKMITIKKDGVEITVDTVEEAKAILTTEKAKRTYKPRKKYKIKKSVTITKAGRPRKTGSRHVCQRCGKHFLSPRETAKYCTRTCSGIVNGHLNGPKNMLSMHMKKGHAVGDAATTSIQ